MGNQKYARHHFRFQKDTKMSKPWSLSSKNLDSGQRSRV